MGDWWVHGVDYHQFFLAPVGVDPILDPSRPALLLQLTDNGRSLIVCTGMRLGSIRVSIGSESAPTPPTEEDWEERDEALMTITDDLLFSSPLMINPGPGPWFIPERPGLHRVVVLARGRKLKPDASIDPRAEPVEEYVVWIRPAANEPSLK